MKKINKVLLSIGMIATISGMSSCYAASGSDNMLLFESLSSFSQTKFLYEAFDKVSESSTNLANELLTPHKDALQKLYKYYFDESPADQNGDAISIFQKLPPALRMIFWDDHKEMIDNVLKQLPLNDFSNLLVKYRPDIQDQWEEEEDGDNVNPNLNFG